MPFRKGQSGNPSGKRRYAPADPTLVPTEATVKAAEAKLKGYASQFSLEAIDGLVKMGRDKKCPASARVAAWKEVLDRGHGRAAQALTGADGNELKIPGSVTYILHAYVQTEASLPAGSST